MPSAKDFRHGHRDRVRARFLREGLSAFADYEVLELLLKTQNCTRLCCQAELPTLMKRVSI